MSVTGLKSGVGRICPFWSFLAFLSFQKPQMSLWYFLKSFPILLLVLLHLLFVRCTHCSLYVLQGDSKWQQFSSRGSFAPQHGDVWTRFWLLQLGWLASAHELDPTPRASDGQGRLACCSLWGCKESDTTQQLNNNKNNNNLEGLGATGIQLIESRHAAKHPAAHVVIPPQQMSSLKWKS